MTWEEGPLIQVRLGRGILDGMKTQARQNLEDNIQNLLEVHPKARAEVLLKQSNLLHKKGLSKN